MRPISRTLFKILNNEKFQPIDMLDVTPLGGDSSSVISLTNAGQSFDFDGRTYTPINMAPGSVREMIATDTGNFPSVTMTITNIDIQMAALLNRVEIEGSQGLLRRTDRRIINSGSAKTQDAFVVANGEIRDAQLTEQTLVFQIISIMGLLERLVVPRRLYQPLCNYTFGSAACGVDISASPLTLTCTPQAGTTADSVVVPASILTNAGATEPTEFWANGYILMDGNAAALQARPIQRVDASTNRFYLRHPYLSNPGAEGTAIIRRGCRKTKTDCRNRQSSTTADNFGGFEELPYARINPVTVEH